MARFKHWRIASASVAVSLVGIIGSGAAPAGAQAPSTGSLALGTYGWFIDGNGVATITLASGNTFTTALDGGDTGTWVQSGTTAALTITGGTGGPAGCIFAGKLNSTGTGIGSAGKPGNWVCHDGSSGTFYIVKSGGTSSRTNGAALVRPRSVPTASQVVPRKYTWTLNGDNTFSIKLASNHSFKSTFDNDTGEWVQGGPAVALTITGGGEGGGGCLFVGKGNKTGTAIASSTKPGNWACPGLGVSGTFYTS
jgi:hypothetical protein